MSRRLDPTDDQLERWMADERAHRLKQLTDEECKWDSETLTDDEDKGE